MHFLGVLFFNLFVVVVVNTQELALSIQHFCHFDTFISKNDSCPYDLDVLEEYSKSDLEWKIDFEVLIFIYN